MNAARAKNQDVLVMFTARRGCYSNGKYSKSSACRAPSKAAYTTAFKKFKAAFPWVKTYAPWNEANHVSQPTAKSPKRAADYYAAMRANCKGCKILAADVLDQSTVTSWLKSFIRYSKNKGRVWGLHNYKDVNRKQSKGLTNVLKTVPGEVWLTETGGITKFESSGFKKSDSRAASATKYMFQLADRFDSRKKGYKSKVTRIYVYRWWGEPDGTFDSGLVNPDGSKRPAYDQFAKYAKRPPEVVQLTKVPRDLGQPVLRYADPPVLRHAQGHGGGRGGRRAALRGPRRSPSSASASRRCSGWRPRSSSPAARCATRSPSGCTSGRAATRRSCTASRTRSSPRPAARPPSRAR